MEIGSLVVAIFSLFTMIFIAYFLQRTETRRWLKDRQRLELDVFISWAERATDVKVKYDANPEDEKVMGEILTRIFDLIVESKYLVNLVTEDELTDQKYAAVLCKWLLVAKDRLNAIMKEIGNKIAYDKERALSLEEVCVNVKSIALSSKPELYVA